MPPTTPAPRAKAPLAWDLDRLGERELRTQYGAMAVFAEQLQAMGVTVPPCWYFHRHLVHRFAAVMAWRDRAHRTSTETTDPETGERRVGPGAPAKEAAEWWASNLGLAGLVATWSELECVARAAGGPTSHPGPDGRPARTPELEDVVEAHVAYLRSLR